ncbi:MAG: hypothetical protein U9Q82_06050 [Chloroflexota bacterium]|nr:hypothetical protein [Chloroflexota bacterium]
MAIKQLMTWNIIRGREQEYFEFVVRKFIPEIQQLGLEPIGAWVTAYGDRPQILIAAQTGSLSELDLIMTSNEWDELISQLLNYVGDLEFKTVRSRPGFQM